jgi:5'-methylthioadenosine phosphorylase
MAPRLKKFTRSILKGEKMLGIIGGTGLYNIEGFSDLETRAVETPFGPPSAPVTLGRIDGNKIAFLPRHGKGHGLLPGEINYRANIWALKSVGVTRVMSVSATGSLEEQIRPGDFAIPDQYIDWTKGRRALTYFGNGLVAHVSTAAPACANLTHEILQVGKTLGSTIHSKKTYVCVEGPRLGTKAESLMFRLMGCQLVGMTNVPEAFLAREAQLCYCTIAIATDYDCWMEDPEQHASVEKVFALYGKNLARVTEIIKKVASRQSEIAGGVNSKTPSCNCRTSLSGAVVTPVEQLGPEQKTILAMLLK